MIIQPSDMKMSFLFIQNKHSGDKHDIHIEMDKIIVLTLRELGYSDAMDVYEEQDK